MSFAIGNVAAQVSVHTATSELAELHPGTLTHESTHPSDNALLRQGIIVIGGHPAELHPAVAAATSGPREDSGAIGSRWADSLPAGEGGGFSGFLHTIANLGAAEPTSHFARFFADAVAGGRWLLSYCLPCQGALERAQRPHRVGSVNRASGAERPEADAPARGGHSMHNLAKAFPVGAS